jgi:hypothetical protein
LKLRATSATPMIVHVRLIDSVFCLFSPVNRAEETNFFY